MVDWPTVASLATATGTLVLAAATFASVRSANRAARAAERSLLAGLRPLLVATRLDEPPQKVGWQDRHYARLPGGRAVVEDVDGVIYLAASVRNAGNGIAVLDAWHACPGSQRGVEDHAPLDEFRRLTRDLFIPAGDPGFWQAAVRNGDDPWGDMLRRGLAEGEGFTVEILYGDHQGGQRTIVRFALAPITDGFLCAPSRYWSLDMPDPR
jgi:hypothetical protein